MLTDEAVRFFVYDHIMSAGLPPTVEQTGLELSRTLDEVKTCFQRGCREAHAGVTTQNGRDTDGQPLFCRANALSGTGWKSLILW